MSRVIAVVQAAQEIVGRPEGRHELVRLASALTHVYLACMAKLMETPQDAPFLGRQPPENDCTLLSMPQVADMLHIPEYSARELGRSGALPTVHIGTSVRVRLTALREFIRKSETNGLHQGQTEEVRPRLPRRIRA